MAAGIKICKVCGCEYPYCKTASVPGVFRYQDVACSEEHGAIYLKQVMESRKPKKVVSRKAAKKAVVVEEAPEEEKVE